MLVTGHRYQTGAGLIEVLIAFTIFASGVMGLFSTQISAKKANHSAAQVSIATGLARDMLVRMRSNSSVLQDYVVENFGEHSAPESGACRVGLCSKSELAVDDLNEWGRLLRGENERAMIGGVDVSTGGLVSPLACIENSGGHVRVIISWLGRSKLASVHELQCSGVDLLSHELRSEISLATYIGESL